jgi:cytochrome oxidase Cu insertion factor (SCO1/SenC/PrrC family)
MPGYYSFERLDSQQVGGKMEYDSVFHQVADVELTNQLGQKVSLNKDLKGKMLVIDFFFTTCPSICPLLTTNMHRLQTSYKKDPKKEASLDTVVQFISIQVNPERDTFRPCALMPTVMAQIMTIGGSLQGLRRLSMILHAMAETYCWPRRWWGGRFYPYRENGVAG